MNIFIVKMYLFFITEPFNFLTRLVHKVVLQQQVNAAFILFTSWLTQQWHVIITHFDSSSYNTTLSDHYKIKLTL